MLEKRFEGVDDFPTIDNMIQCKSAQNDEINYSMIFHLFNWLCIDIEWI